MMSVIIDVTRVFRRINDQKTLAGIDRVTMAYVYHYQDKALVMIRWAGRYCILSPKQSKKLFAWLINPQGKFLLTPAVISSFFTKKYISENPILLNMGHIGRDYLNLTSYLKLIFIVHDLIPMQYPEYCCIGEDERHQQKINFILQNATGVITNSQVTKEDFINYAKKTQQKVPPIQVALLSSWFQHQFVEAESEIPKPYFVMIGTIEPRKNHLMILHVWRNLYHILGEKTPILYIIGQRGWECENILDLLDRSIALKKCVREINKCSDKDMINYLKNSQALLFPTFAEGFGLPLVEALALGVPVLASNLQVFKEIAGAIPEYIDPLDGKQWQKLILEYSQPNNVLRAEQIKRMQNFSPATWKQHFKQVNSFLASFN